MKDVFGYIRESILEIADEAEMGDNETAHACEDDLYKSVLHMIATGKGRKKDFVFWAKKVLEVENIKFDRWYS